jgi:geranyl-CoA carboxylase beta subunit
MAILESTVSATSARFAANRDAMLGLLSQVRGFEQAVHALSNKRRDLFEQRGQLPPRERVQRLLDRGSPFLELSTLAGFGLHEDDGASNVLGGAVICGIGIVSGVTCMVIAHDSGIKGGVILPYGMKKQLRAQEIAAENKLPVIYLVESGGGSLQLQSETFVEGGGVFRNQARLSAAGIPQISVVHGSATAGGAYQPGLSDYVIMVRARAKVFLAGPPLLKAATGEIATDEDLGGAEMHSIVSGVADYIVEDDAEALSCARRIVAGLGWTLATEEAAFREPAYSADELAGVVPIDFRESYDVRDVIARLVDGSDFHAFKTNYGPATVCGQAAIEGISVGLIGNNGPIDADGAAKAGHFIQLMCQAGSPIIYLHNITGFLVGVDAERCGIVKHGAKMLQAVANATVPQVTLHIGASFGAGNFGMCGRALQPRFIFAWPNNRIAVMGGEQAAKVMTIITEDSRNRRGLAIDHAALAAQERALMEQFERESTALFATARLWDDGIIDPRDSRRVLAYCLAICRDADRRALHPNSFGVARL